VWAAFTGCGKDGRIWVTRRKTGDDGAERSGISRFGEENMAKSSTYWQVSKDNYSE
jgi:hypothetical protein